MIRPGRWLCRVALNGGAAPLDVAATVLVRRLREADGLSFGNSIYSVTFNDRHESKQFPEVSPFGIAYTFYLAEAVDHCEEYLVHLPALRKLAAAKGLRVEDARNFCDFFSAEWGKHQTLLERMRVLPDGGAISEDEWEVAHTYMVVTFRKEGVVDRPVLPRSRGHQHVREDQIILLDGANGGATGVATSSPSGARPGGGHGGMDSPGGREQVIPQKRGRDARRPCRFFNAPGGCRRGDQCAFAHSTAPAGASYCPQADDSRSVSKRQRVMYDEDALFDS